MSIDVIPQLPLTDPEHLPLQPGDAIAQLGSTLVVAPHPDDETLGCGGVIASLRCLGIPVRVLVLSDGTRSHPNSRKYPPLRLRSLREQETLSALRILGVKETAVTFLGLQDGAIPVPELAGFDEAVTACRAYLTRVAPATILLPWRRDPHADHRAAWRLIQEALNDFPLAPRLLEYLVWSWEQPEEDDVPIPKKLTAWRFDVSLVLSQKLEAIAAHRSQITDLIDDDPEGFRLLPEVLAHFAKPWELFLEIHC